MLQDYDSQLIFVNRRITERQREAERVRLANHITRAHAKPARLSRPLHRVMILTGNILIAAGQRLRQTQQTGESPMRKRPYSTATAFRLAAANARAADE